MRDLKDALDELIRSQGWETKLALEMLSENWESYVGTSASKSTTPKKITEKGVLIIDCEQSTWKTELSLRKQELIKKINNRLNAKVIREIIFN